VFYVNAHTYTCVYEIVEYAHIYVQMKYRQTRHCSRADGLRVHLKKFHVISGVHVIRSQ